MRKIMFLLLMILFIPFVEAASFQYGIIKTESGLGVNVRSGPGTLNYDKLSTGIPEGGIVRIIDTVDTDDGSTGCSSNKWHKIEYVQGGLEVGYVCSNLVEIKEINEEVTIKGKVNNKSGIFVKDNFTTNSNSISDGLAFDRTVKILEEINSSDELDECSTKKWYKISYNESETGFGYVCTESITIIDSNVDPEYNYSEELAKFPVSYHQYLNKLHEDHPAWKFYAVNINKTLEEIRDAQSIIGKSLINTKYEGWRSIKEGAYDYKTDTWKGYDGTNWKAANPDIVAYYLDPRNFLNEERIFMFEDLKYHDYQTENGVQSILNGTFMESTFIYDNNDYKYSLTFVEAGRFSSVSPYVLAARVKQEVVLSGGKASGSASGTVSGYVGYYNFFNIGAYAANGNDAVINGLIYAQNKGWNSPYKAIVEGSVFIGDNYILKGQQTLYFQKFNVNPASDYTINTHQYMTNIEAPYSEAYTTYKAYVTNGDINKDIVFYIPVYENMLESYKQPNTGNPNNWLSDLKIDNVTLEGFDGEVVSYNYNTDKKSIEIAANTVNSKAVVTGTGKFDLIEGLNKFDLVVTSENGNLRTYTINVNKVSEEIENIITVDEIVDKISVKINEEFMSGIKIGTTYESFKNIVLKQYDLATVKLINSNNEVKNTSFATGDTIEISNGVDTKSYKIIIYGDLSGDGDITLADLLAVQKIILNKSNLSGSYLKAGDINKDNNINLSDLLAVQKHLLGTEIVQ